MEDKMLDTSRAITLRFIGILTLYRRPPAQISKAVDALAFSGCTVNSSATSPFTEERSKLGDGLVY